MSTNHVPGKIRGGIPRIALIGCGAVAETLYLPALQQHAGMLTRAVLVDSDIARARSLAGRFGVPNYSDDYAEILDDIDAAIVATPPATHSALALAVMRKSIPVLCEKPLADTAGEARSMLETAAEQGPLLCVNNTRRFFASYREVHRLITSGVLGDIYEIQYSEGAEFRWPTTTGFYFRSAGGAKGVLQDRGSHVLDLVCWWLSRKPDLVSYEDDSYGGPEAMARMSFRAGSAEVKVALSWLGKLENRYLVRGSAGSVSGDIYDWRSVEVRLGKGQPKVHRLRTGQRYFSDFGRAVVDDFLAAVTRDAAPQVTAADVLPSIELIDECYARRRRLAMPWNAHWEAIGAS